MLKQQPLTALLPGRQAAVPPARQHAHTRLGDTRSPATAQACKAAAIGPSNVLTGVVNNIPCIRQPPAPPLRCSTHLKLDDHTCSCASCGMRPRVAILLARGTTSAAPCTSCVPLAHGSCRHADHTHEHDVEVLSCNCICVGWEPSSCHERRAGGNGLACPHGWLRGGVHA